MKIVILGGGVIGVTSAWYLAQAGHEVVVIDRQSAVAQETSFANAGEISPGYASPWAAPGIPAKAMRWLNPTPSSSIWRKAAPCGQPIRASRPRCSNGCSSSNTAMSPISR